MKWSFGSLFRGRKFRGPASALGLTFRGSRMADRTLRSTYVDDPNSPVPEKHAAPLLEGSDLTPGMPSPQRPRRLRDFVRRLVLTFYPCRD